MKLSLSHAALADVAADLLVALVPRQRYAEHPVFQELDRALRGELARIAKQEAFGDKSNKKEAKLSLHTFGKIAAHKLLVMGVAGDTLNADALRAASVQAARAASEENSLAIVSPTSNAGDVRAIAEGLQLGDYRYTPYLTGARKPKPGPRGQVVLAHKPAAADRHALEEANTVSEAVNLARDMVNGPPNVLTSSALANEAQRIARQYGLRCVAWGKRELEKRGMRLLLAVNAGSGEEPRFIHMAYVPKLKRKVARLVFVGKGLTFDAGGLSIKNAKSMTIMKCDMAGGATTIAIIMAAARLKLPVEVHAIVPSTDNMLGGKAFKPGDVYQSLDGKTVEVLDTDAEGRLILADALTYAVKLEPTVLIDHGTLTGDCIAALGNWRAGLYATDDALRDRYLDAAKRSGEAFWPLPLDADLKQTIESPIADIKNTGDGTAGSIAAALFLREFVGETGWIHLDIAGPAFLPAAHDVSPKGGTGFGVRTALEFIKSYA